jgi:hypothetical protein
MDERPLFILMRTTTSASSTTPFGEFRFWDDAPFVRRTSLYSHLGSFWPITAIGAVAGSSHVWTAPRWQGLFGLSRRAGR